MLDLTVAVDMTTAAAYVRMSYGCTIMWSKPGQQRKGKDGDSDDERL